MSPLQVLLPLTDQTFKNHCLYFLSTPSKSLSSCGCASNKEKEMVTRYRAEQYVIFVTIIRILSKSEDFSFNFSSIFSYFLSHCLPHLCSRLIFSPVSSVSWQHLSDTGFLSLVRLALPLSARLCASFFLKQRMFFFFSFQEVILQ